MAGTFGLKAANYALSLAAGRPMLEELARPRVLFGSTECSTCRMQMEDGAGKRTLHPAQYLALAYGLMPELRDRLHEPDSATGAAMIVLSVCLPGPETWPAPSVDVELPAGATVADLRRRLARGMPGRWPACCERSALAVNDEFAERSHALAGGAEIACCRRSAAGCMMDGANCNGRSCT